MTNKKSTSSNSSAKKPSVPSGAKDNYLFWTFKPHENIPATAIAPLEKMYGDFLAKKHGSLDKAKEAWGAGGQTPKGDDFANGRAGLYPAGSLTGQEWARNQRNQKRAEDQAQFLTENLRGFYTDMQNYFRKDLGVKCCITASNWTTADNQILGAMDKYTNLVCDTMDRHAYFSGPHSGDRASYSVAAGQTYEDKTGMYGPASLVPELQYTGHPHIVSEWNYPMPNRFRTECPWLTATFGSLAGTDGHFQFAIGTAEWQASHTKFSVYTPATMGQFPATALAFRKGYFKEGPVVYHAAVNIKDLYTLKGTPIAEPQNLDDMRKADIPAGGKKEIEGVVAMDPLAFYVGQVTMTISDAPGKSSVTDITKYIDREKKTLSSATGEMAWDWGKGIATANAPCAQGACGFLKAAGKIDTADLSIESNMEYGDVLAVSLDGQPLATSKKILLQAMSEDQNYGWKTTGDKKKTIVETGAPPMLVKNIDMAVTFKKTPAKATALDANGNAGKALEITGGKVVFPKDVMYICVER